MRTTRIVESPVIADVHEVASLDSAKLQSDQMSQSDLTEVSLATSGQRQGGLGGSVSGDSDSDSDSDSDRELYSEDESEDSDHIFAKPGSAALPDFLKTPQGHNITGSRSVTDSSRSLPSATRSTRRGGNDNSTSEAKGTTFPSRSSIPTSSSNSSSLKPSTIGSQLNYFVRNLRYIYKTMEEDRLPWMTDFADIHKMRLPRRGREIAGRLNLNIPYYHSNYREISYLITMPLLLVYNLPFFIVTLLTVSMVHHIRLQKRRMRTYGNGVVVLGRLIRYRKLGHALLIAVAILLLFFDGLQTLLWVLLLNLCIIVPHALIRKPTYFDDEDLEKCRPKLGQYAICLVVLVLAYLEGDPCDDEAAENRRVVQQERKRMAQVVTSHETKNSS
ncbi:hypothetical protein JKF63_02175 [Porcisia hertigi]|uniref:PRA1 family protein n=1 Tax=Porcisia hertigi TaxID=2761500 RepID=A0A836HZ07_9TRYP|nr:hypothetical protein JKF63_02175 [Porcisia hertigi]